MMRKTLSICAVLAVVAAPAVADEKKPFGVSFTGVNVSLQASTGDFSLTIKVEQLTDATGAQTTSLELLYSGSDGSFILFPAGGVANLALSVSGNGKASGEGKDDEDEGKKKQTINIFVSPFIGVGCDGPCPNGGVISLAFTRNHAYKFTRTGSKKGVDANGTRINETFTETFEGANVTGFVLGVPFSSRKGEISSFRGDPALR